MSVRLVLTAAIALGLSALVHAETKTPMPAAAEVTAANPFLKPSTLEFEYPHFDRMKDEHFQPAIEQGMREQLAEIKAIAENKDAPTFENTIVAIERSGELYKRASTAFYSLTGTVTNDTLNAVRAALAPKTSAHSDAISLNAALFARIDALYAKRAELKLDAESERLLWRYRTDFVRAGAKLAAADQDKLKALNSEIATLQTQFTQNVLDETNASAVHVTDRKRLAGLSDSEIAAAEAGAKKAGKPGYLIALLNTTGQPANASLLDRDLRAQIQKASETRAAKGGKFDNRAITLKLAALRAKRALLLGYPDHASYVLEDETAQSKAAVNKLMAELAVPAVANAKREAADIQKMIDDEKGAFKLAASDWSFYSEKVRAEKYAYDEAQLRPYFEARSVLENGIFFAATKLYGITFKERTDLPKYHPTLRTFDVIDADGSKLAILIADLYARPSKRGGAWASRYVSQSKLLDTRSVAAFHLNVPEPPKGEATLMTYDEVTTAFHEFGHVLHGIFSNVQYPRFSGTSVPRDFVEYPSQVNEMWTTWPEVLANYAKHYQTGEPMPQALLDKVRAASKFNQGFTTTEYLAATLLDQQWHQLTPDTIPTDAIAFEQAALQKAGVDFAPVPPRYRSTYFTHIFSGGYSAGYYAYIWSEVLDADSVEWFKENGGLKRENGDHFRKTLLSKGGSVDAMQLFRDFRGRDKNIEPLLIRRGLK